MLWWFDWLLKVSSSTNERYSNLTNLKGWNPRFQFANNALFVLPYMCGINCPICWRCILVKSLRAWSMRQVLWWDDWLLKVSNNVNSIETLILWEAETLDVSLPMIHFSEFLMCGVGCPICWGCGEEDASMVHAWGTMVMLEHVNSNLTLKAWNCRCEYANGAFFQRISPRALCITTIWFLFANCCSDFTLERLHVECY